MSRRQKRLYLSHPSPRVLHLPSRSVWRTARPGKVDMGGGSGKEKLGTLFERERRFRMSSEGCVLVEEAGEGDEAWRFQEEVLRAELRRSRSSAEKILRSTIQALVDGRRRIAGGMDIQSVIEEEIENLVGKLGELRRKTRRKVSEGGRSCSNFNTVYGSPEKAGEAPWSRISEQPLEGNNEHSVELLRRKMEGLSKDVLLEKMVQEYGSILSSSKRIEWQLPQSVLATRESSQNIVSGAKNVCSGHCKAVVRRIIEQVRSETEQWSQIQTMLSQLRGEMEELQVSRDIWEDMALDNCEH
ncbi:hypothetical protein MLD38_004195 [Melastoma candidum]|uniref:Uncharacterized protein n=1 Tax=Melastoma candidum TaxID=119954 RepID=A0ACB9S537_9MYRT|nr:hypothetical protein MLD38_004195 [Melastoma candidum]